MSAFDMGDLERRMDGALTAFHNEMAGLRTGRASTAILDPVNVEVYGSRMPLTQLASVNVPEPRLITVQVWDKDNVKAVEKAISNAGLGLNPQAEGQLIRLPVPELSEERRKELAKLGGKYAESARVSVRNVRRDGMEKLKKLEKDSEISEDECKRLSDRVQKATDQHVEKIDDLLKVKEQEIMQV